MTEKQNTQPVESAYAIRHENGQLLLLMRIVLDDSETKISNGGEGDNYTEHSTYWVDGNKRGKTDIVDDQGKLHTITPFTVYTAIKDTRKPVKSSKIKPVAKMTKQEQQDYIAELEANQK